tara:strand:+ start:569 stop:949 length:381 start_codon:yes stop_codon:yes gene_type:complete
MDPTRFLEATAFARGVIKSNTRESLEDDWYEFSDDIDINIYWVGDGPIKAVAHPIRENEDGTRWTDTTRDSAVLPVSEDVMTYRRTVFAPSVNTEDPNQPMSAKETGRLLCHNGMEPYTEPEVEHE